MRSLSNIESVTAYPERYLLAAILARAILDSSLKPYKSLTHKDHRYKNAQLKSDALIWVFSENLSRFSFLWICEILEMCPIILRRLIKRDSDKSIRKDTRVLFKVQPSATNYNNEEFFNVHIKT